MERKHGSLGRVWIFDRGIVSEENLELLRRRGARYLVATPRRKLAAFEQELLKDEDWAQVAGRPEIEVKLLAREAELYVLSRNRERAERERKIRLQALPARLAPRPAEIEQERAHGPAAQARLRSCCG